MSVARTSITILRSGIRSGIHSARAPLVRPGFVQIRSLTHDKGTNDLGGPYGQTPRPEKPGGVDAIRRNWLRVAGGALLLVAMVAYASKEPKRVQGKIEQGKQAVGAKAKG